MFIMNDQILSDYVVTDLETTGLSPENDRIIEIAAVRVVNRRVESVFSVLVDPQIHIPSYITDITGIDDSMVRGKPHIEEAMADFLDFTGELPLLGHNIIRFDMRFLSRYASLSNRCADTLLIAEHMETGSRGLSLSELCARFGVKNLNAHRAEYDCLATHEVYLGLMELYRQKGAFIKMAVGCGKKEFQENIRSFCKADTELTYSKNEKGTLSVFVSGKPVGTVSGGKQRELEVNAPLVKKLYADRLSVGAGGKFLLGAKAVLMP